VSTKSQTEIRILQKRPELPPQKHYYQDHYELRQSNADKNLGQPVRDLLKVCIRSITDNLRGLIPFSLNGM
jgi:hypothetical protein